MKTKNFLCRPYPKLPRIYTGGMAALPLSAALPLPALAKGEIVK